MQVKTHLPASVLALLALPLSAPLGITQDIITEEDYLAPPAKILEVITSRAMHHRVSLGNLGPDGEHFLITRSGGMPPLSSLARPYVNLGETAIDHHANRTRSLSLGNTVALELFSHRTGKKVVIAPPDGMSLGSASWAPDGKSVAYFGHGPSASHLYVADVASGNSRRVTERPLLLTLTSTLQWTLNGKSIAAVFVPEKRGPLPQRDPVANEPGVWNTHDGKTPSRTYRFLLKSPYQKKLLEYLSTGQLALVDVASGKLKNVGQPAMFTSVSMAPDGKHFRVTTMQKPFSYFVPRRSFGSVEELWNQSGKSLARIRERKLRVGSQRGGGAPGGASGDRKEDPKRSLTWLADGKGLAFLQREPRKKKTGKDEVKGDGAAAKKKDAAASKNGAPVKTDPPRQGTRRSMRPGAPQKADPKKMAATSGAAKDEKKDEKKDGAENKKEEKRLDRLVHWFPPFGEKDIKVVWQSETPISSVSPSDDGKLLFITQTIKGKRTIFAVDPKKPEKHLKVHESESKRGEEATAQRARFMRGGRRQSLMTKRGSRGVSVVRSSSDGKHVYLRGTDQPKKGEEGAPRPYVDRIEIGTAKKTRVWQGGSDVSESLLAVLDDDLSQFVISRESKTKVPQSHLYDARSKEAKVLTRNLDPAPEVTRARRLRFQVTRVDGFKFWVNATVPREYGQRLPALFWFYPREYPSQKAYDDSQRRQNPHRFPRMSTRSMELLTMLGYVVVRPDCPIVGEAGRMNDNFVPDLRNNLWAVIDELDKREIIDRDRLAIGGHSYGAFGTANALAHTPFFKAGIAGDGNYNRTLTPMAFQSERRYFWDARETYITMSPLFWANQVNGALLMYHGTDDTNSGTFPIHSPRMFQALDGLGKKAALYMYPYEGHGPRAQETVLDLWARWVRWLDVHVKYAGQEVPDAALGVAGSLTEGRRRR